ncbi:MAG: glycoside hydrolase family 15 protein [Caldimonas sp.]
MTKADARTPPYRPIADYALIGDCHGAALVARDGSIDWATLHRFDAEPVFCRLLDAGRGGHWSIRPVDAHTSERAYVGDTNILRTVFRTADGSVALTDFMPVGRRHDAGLNDYVHLSAPQWIVRRVQALPELHKRIELKLEYRPSTAFARVPAELQAARHAVCAGPEMPMLFGAADFEVHGDTATACLLLGPGEQLDFVLADNCVEGEAPCARVEEFLAATRAFWEEWIAYCRHHGPHEAAVRRSALALKLLSFAPTGAIVAAPTTSLPERIGGERNWDYRYCWVRDASFALYALAVLGYSGEARCFNDFLLQACARSLPRVRPMYGIDGRLDLREQTLDHLEGYLGSAPVRSGNGAYLQQQIDAYGQVFDLAWTYQSLGGRLHRQYRRLLRALARYSAAHWHEPDQGIWEMRGPPRQHVHSKLMSWVALDRAQRLLGGDGGDGCVWGDEAKRIAADIHRHGGAAQREGLRQAYDGGTDAAVLLAPMLGFPLDEATLTRTIDRVTEELSRGDFLARYAGDDGLEGGEGAFLVCSSWLIDAQLASGRIDEARAGLDRLYACANDVGLFAEEIDVRDGSMLGNFPQALTHLGLIGNAVNLKLAEDKGEDALRGGYADRARRVVGSTFGWRGVLAAMWQSRRIGRLRGSKASRLMWP